MDQEISQSLNEGPHVEQEGAHEEVPMDQRSESSVRTVHSTPTNTANSEADLPEEELELRLEALREHNAQFNVQAEQRKRSRREQLLKELNEERARFYQLQTESSSGDHRNENTLNTRGVPNNGSAATAPEPRIGSNSEPTQAVHCTEEALVKIMEAMTQKNNGKRPAVLKQSPPKFEGEPEQAVIWLKDYRLIAQSNQWTHVEMAQYLPTALQSKAKEWFHGEYDGIIPEWKEFEVKFLEVFVPAGYEQECKRKFYSLKRAENEKPIDYLNKLLYLRTQMKPKPSESEIVDCIKIGVLGMYAPAIMNLSSLSEVRSTLSRLTKLNEDREQYRAQTRPNNRTDNVRPQHREVEIVHEQKKAKEFEPTCFNCGKTKHFARNCPEPRDAQGFKRRYIELVQARNMTSAPLDQSIDGNEADVSTEEDLDAQSPQRSAKKLRID